MVGGAFPTTKPVTLTRPFHSPELYEPRSPADGSIPQRTHTPRSVLPWDCTMSNDPDLTDTRSRGAGASDAARPDVHPTSPPSSRVLLARAGLGGVLMGLANLVPGVSGGTMLLAAGVYREFVDSIARFTRLRPTMRALLVLGTVAGAAAVAILLGAGLLKDLVVQRRWIMYALFVGLTLGGIPLVWRPIRRKSLAYWSGLAGGLGFMIALFWLQQSSPSAGDASSNALALGAAGAAGASAMILPGLSGGYLLLLMGQYVPILSGVDRLKTALVARDVGAILDVGFSVILPVGLGVVVGVVVVSNLVQWFFRRYEQATYGVLLGLLLGAVVGLWPFQRPVDPIFGETVIKGRVVTESTLQEFDLEDYPTEIYRPGAGQVAGALGLTGLGLAATLALARPRRED